MTSQKTDMTPLDCTHAAHKKLAAGNEREAAGLLWKAAEATFLDLARKRGIECDGDDSFIDLAKALESDASVSKWYFRGSLGGATLLKAHAEFEALESWNFIDVYRDTLDFVLEVNLPEALNGKR